MNKQRKQVVPGKNDQPRNTSGTPGQHASNTDAQQQLNASLRRGDLKQVAGRQAPLPHRAQMETSFGVDLGGVSALLGADLGWLGVAAATDGETLAFAEEDPDVERVAHEVSHYLQFQDGGGGGGLSSPQDAAEVEARDIGQMVAQGLPVSVNAQPNAAIHADPPAPGEDVGTWSDTFSSDIESEGVIQGADGAAFPEVFPSIDAAVAYAGAWLGSHRSDGAAVISVDGGYQLIAVDVDSWWSFDVGNLTDNDQVNATQPEVVRFVTKDGLSVLPGQVMTDTASGPQAASPEGYQQIIDLHASGALDMDDEELGELFEQMVRARAIETLDANAAYIRDTVGARYEGDQAADNVAELRARLVEYDGMLTAGAAMFSRWFQNALRINSLTLSVERLTQQTSTYVDNPDIDWQDSERERYEGLLRERDADQATIDTLMPESEQLMAALTLQMAATGMMLMEYPELERVIDKSDAPTVDIYRQELPTEDSYTSRIEGLSDAAAAQLVRGEIASVLEDIAEGRNKLLTGDISPLALDRLAGPLIEELQTSNPALAAAGQTRLNDYIARQQNINLIIGAIDLGLFVAGLFTGGLLSFALMAGSSVVSAGGVVMNLEHAMDMLTMANTHLDPGQALADGGAAREAMFWAAVDGALLVLDGIGTVGAFSEVQRARRAATSNADDARRVAGIDPPIPTTAASAAAETPFRGGAIDLSTYRATAADRAGFRASYANYDDQLAFITEARRKYPELAGIPDEDLIALRGYTSMDYGALNQPLRTQNLDDLDDVGDYIRTASSGLNQLPPVPGTSYRGVDSLPANVLDQYQPGNIVTERAFTSSSSDPTRSFGGPIRFTIEGVSGRDVSILSEFPDETEILFAPGTRFEVITRTDDAATGEIAIFMREVAPGSMP